MEAGAAKQPVGSAVSRAMSQEERQIYELVLHPEIALTAEEHQEVKALSRKLVEALKSEKLVLDWRKKWHARADVQLTINKMLDRLPRRYGKEVYELTCDRVYQHVYERYHGQRRAPSEAGEEPCQSP